MRDHKLELMLLLPITLIWSYVLVALPFNMRIWWAFSFYKYVPVHYRIALLAIPLAGVVIFTVIKLPLDLRGFELDSILHINVLAIIAVSSIIIWVFRERTIWGDGLQIIAVLEGRDMPWNAPFNWCWHEPLTWLLTVGWYHLGKILFDWNGLSSMHALNAVLGALSVGAVWRLVKTVAKSGEEAAFLFLVAISSGATQVIFAHVENYTLVTLLSVLAITNLFDDWNTLSKALVSGIWVGAAVSAHPVILLTISFPWAYTIARLVFKKKTLFIMVNLTGVLIPMLFTVFVSRAYGADLRNVIFHQHHLITSFAEITRRRHVISETNTLILTLLPQFLFVLILLTNTRSLIESAKESSLYFLTLLFVVLSPLVLRSTIPSPLDWDVFAPLALSSMIVLGFLLAKLELYNQTTRSVLWGLLAISFSFTIPWIWINASVIRVWPDPFAVNRDLPYVEKDLVKLFPGAQIEHPPVPLCSQDTNLCKYVFITKFGVRTHAGYLEHPVLFDHPPASISFSLHLRKGHYFFWGMPALDPVASSWPGDGVTFIVKVKGTKTPEKIWVRYVPKSSQGWQQIFIDLSAFSGQNISLTLATGPGPHGDFTGDRAGWGIPRIMRGRFEGTYQSLWGY